MVRAGKFRMKFSKIYTRLISGGFKSFGAGSVIYPWATRIVGEKYISIGNDVFFDDHIQLTAWDRYGEQHFTPEITIGDGSAIGSSSHITAVNRICIGKNVLTGKNVLITDNAHGLFSEESLAVPPRKRSLVSKGPVVIEDNVWIGDKATVLPGVRIGAGSIVGANAVVTRDVPPHSLVVGNPGRIIPLKNK
ncbi:MAG: acyltransferase [Bacteroidales bacterium]|nr:acyltransferase [Bacteroidales bacterium]